ncbi:TonB-dependent receptor [Selenomonas sp. F0473]|uniref:TonB-dependent receptor n=1 Tax=Selenomonas sp. F0473 TaxID=999423 RepID=UPI0025E3F42C|nr:TonB-dependent receptor [Selenomonas sp. F0473]
MRKSSAALIAALLLTPLWGQRHACAEDIQEYTLAPVDVRGERARVLPGGFQSDSGAVGMLGTQNIMKEPFDQTNYTEKTITRFADPTNNFVSIMLTNPSVRNGSIVTHSHFFVHGVYTHGSYILINGVPNLLGQYSTPTFFADQIELTTSPNMGLNGSRASYASGNQGNASPATINFRTKTAGTAPVTRYTQAVSGRGALTEQLDVGRRFGKGDAWGARLNILRTKGEISIPRVDRDEYGCTLNLDRRGRSGSSNLFVGTYYLNLDGGGRWFSLGPNVTSLPKVPDHYNNYDFDGQYKWEKIYMAAFNHEQKLGGAWRAFLNAGYSDHRFHWSLGSGYAGWTIKNDAGDFDTRIYTDYQDWKTYYAQLGLRGDLKAGALTHHVSLAFDKSWFDARGPQSSLSFPTDRGGGNIYEPFDRRVSHSTAPHPAKVQKEREYIRSYSLNDNIEIGKFNVLLGIQHHDAKVTAGAGQRMLSDSAVCPTVGFNYTPEENIAVYASHTEGFTRPSVVGNQYVNRGTILPATKLKQNEIGLKYKTETSLFTFSAFRITQAQNIAISIAPGRERFIGDGQVRYMGFSASYTGQIGEKWNAVGGIEYVNSRQMKTDRGIFEGASAYGTPKWNGVLALEYQPDKQWSILGRMVFTGKANTVNTNKTKMFDVPSNTVFDLGVGYRTQWNRVPVTLNLMCYNLFDRNYWYGSRTGLMLSQPRTVTFSAAFDL